MTERERRTLAGVASFLLLASLVRHGLERRTIPVPLPEDTADATALAAESAAILDDEEARSRPLGPDETIDVNRASEVELDRLAGVGAATAAAIVREREARGAFASADDLVRVRGIGPATVERLRGHVAVGPGATASRPPIRSLAAPASGIDINRASEEELTELPGVGPAIAGRIVRTRAERGGFSGVGDLLDVPGIGPATLERIRARVVARP